MGLKKSVEFQRFGFILFFVLGGATIGPAQAWERPGIFPLEELISDFGSGAFLPDLNPSLSETQSAMTPVSSFMLPDRMPDGDLAAFRQALAYQVESCKKKDLNAKVYFGTRIVTRKEWCIDTAVWMWRASNGKRSFAEFWSEIKNKLEWYQSVGADANRSVRFTGYYLPALRGERRLNGSFHYPFYSRPKDLVQVMLNGVPVWRRRLPNGTLTYYHDRMAIDWRNVLRGQGLEILHVDDAIEAFFAHIQGSAAVYLNEAGTRKRVIVNYTAANGLAYESIGSILKKEGVPAEYLTLQGLRRYFRERPQEIQRVFTKNPSYIFFKELIAGPYGAAGTPVTPGHSIATDPRYFPMNSLAFVDAWRPAPLRTEETWMPFSRFMINEDTGGAIRGPGRVDTYWGEGEYAERAAGQMNHIGKLYFALLPAL